MRPQTPAPGAAWRPWASGRLAAAGPPSSGGARPRSLLRGAGRGRQISRGRHRDLLASGAARGRQRAAARGDRQLGALPVPRPAWTVAAGVLGVRARGLLQVQEAASLKEEEGKWDTQERDGRMIWNGSQSIICN